MKIVFVGDGLFETDNYPNVNRGASVQTWGISKELAKRGHEVFILRRNDVNGTKVVEGVNLVSLTFNWRITENMPFILHFARMCSSLFFSSKSVDLIKKIKPDVVCIINRFSGVFSSRLNLPIVYIMHSPDALEFFKPYSLYANRLNSVLFYIKKCIEHHVQRNSCGVVVLNSYIENCLKTTGLNCVTRIPNGIDAKCFSYNGDNNFILYAGRFDWNKNVSSLVKTFAEIHAVHPDYRLCLVGEGLEEKMIRRLVKENGIQSCVQIIPWVPRNILMELMSNCSVFILPSIFEAANPVVVLEAMASAKPVIARANMGTVDIIVHGKNGYLYKNENELKKYLELLLSDNNLRKRVGHAARKTIVDKYAFTQMANKYEEYFHQLLHVS